MKLVKPKIRPAAGIISMLLPVALLLFAGPSQGQAQGEEANLNDLKDLSLDQLLDIDLVQVGSRKPMGKKDIPGTVTLIKREEIIRSGARDLIDVLSLVPGFSFATDVQGVIATATRGLWADEGKALFIVDGIPMNELLYGTMALGNRFPVDQIERIEIVRGPGASFYGGFAELAVVNIVTRKPGANEISASGQVGTMRDAYSRRTVSGSIAKTFGGLEMVGTVYAGESNRSDAVFNGFQGESFPMAGNNVLKPLNVNIGMSYAGARGRFVYDRYNSLQRDGLDIATPVPVEMDMHTVAGNLEYDWKLTDKLTLTPHIGFLREEPYRSTDPILSDTSLPYTAGFNQKTVQRVSGSLEVSGDILPALFATLGVEGYTDKGTVPIEEMESAMYTGSSTSVSYQNIGTYLQSFWTTPYVNVNAGFRYDKNSAVPAAFAPWLGFTRVFNNLNIKLLYGQTFRAPAIENIDLNPAIKPERTSALELELGYQLRYNMYISANLFNTTISDPIVYGVIDGEEKYFNYARTGSRGVELEFLLKDTWGYLNASYSYYGAHDNDIPQYAALATSASLLGIANHKLTLNCSFGLFGNGLTISPSLVYYGKRYGVGAIDDQGVSVQKVSDPVALANVYLLVNNVAAKGLSIGLGVYDLFDARYQFLQPYDGQHAPLPGSTREFLLRVAFTAPI